MQPVMRRRRPAILVATILGLTTLGVVAAPVTPVAAGGFTITSIEAGAPLTGLGSRWSLNVEVGGGESVVTIGRRNAAGTATASLRTRSDDGDVTCTARLASCVVSDAGSLGTYGRVELSFSATGPRTSKERRCAGSSVIRAIEYRRKGVLTGTFKVQTKTDLIGAVRNGAGAHRIPASIPATVTRLVGTGAVCPPVATPPCPEQVGVLADALSAERTLANGGTSVVWRTALASSTTDVVRSQLITVRSTAGALSVNTPSSLGSAVLEIDRGLPFLTGGGLYASSSPKAPSLAFTCSTVERREGAMLRSLTVRFPWQPAAEIEDEVDASVVHVID